MMQPGFPHRVLSAAVSIALGFGWPTSVYALDCARIANFESFDNHVDQAKRAEDLRAREALANLSPIVLSGRLAKVRPLPGPGTNLPTELLTFVDVKILRGDLPRSRIDRRAVIASYEWCDGGCTEEQQRWHPGALLTIGVAAAANAADKMSVGRIKSGRIDGQFGPCGGGVLSPLELKLISTPPEEIARLEHEYPIRKRQ
ncbi:MULTISPECIES: hypothetical protein [Bradyrhizobium]|uniref:Bll1366 protein n=1 Tax=Bradyrhizobium diazoefficiens (strain JCM 10833 / BCRC 13528 / IAM 13628 / NBRC 14792 / USDA 110) TaxID=224911 RepID=Q89UP5_BRADU|nr:MULTISPECIES: hypothetical protein [Bradyrhizobium]MBP1059860.1 hypothetical protein [Bradyrhizobium japonicum]AND87033.1 hypothetical protein AAV28_03740 [Bradyrhizobium diazoefficiens USDA 110]PDT59328.1 hypothetical protein CO678_23650 [Bradyrhizobium diazoefficiens]QBP20302.1 hypothetical protein Bdiaspc4_06815 [Bradyrhizobium diazoefficiens]QHP73565.1 hypothetical protein EI171_43805 [Bradyrhizobium sp. LCT2]